MRNLSILLITALVSALGQTPSPVAPLAEDYVKAHYTKYEYRITMRDGKKLFTSVYVPKDSSQQWPIMMDRTPYSVAPYGEDQYKRNLGPSDEFEKAGYIFVYQDVRGRYQSEGTFVEMTPHIDNKKSAQDVDDASDMYDSIDFLLKHVPNNNGKVGIWGISYPGFYTSASMIDSHPALKACSPQAPMTNLYRGDDGYHGGAFMLDANFGFYTGFTPKTELWFPDKVRDPFDFDTPDGYEFYLQAGPTSNLEHRLKGHNWLFDDQVQHTTYDDYWRARNLAPHLRNIKCAVLTVGGWFDAEDLSGPFNVFHSIEKQDPETVNSLVEGPWVHGGWARGDGDRLGEVEFNAKTGEYFRKNIQFPFFEYYLKGKGAPMKKAYTFETGTNVWRTYDEWPPKEAKARSLYFHANGKLSFEPPSEAEGADEYVSDPAHPVPFVGYVTDTVPQRYMVDDQRFASKRPDVLTYESDVLTEDVTIAGPVIGKLHVSSSGTDSDYVVKLIDVYPADFPDPTKENEGKHVLGQPAIRMGSYQQLLRGEPFRAKFRKSWEKPEPLIPNQPTVIVSEMPDLHHTFRAGHRIMVQVQSSWFPLIDLNPQTFVDIPNAKASDFKKATERIYHSKDRPSAVEVMVMP